MTSYSELLVAAQANPQDADYHALRMAYSRTDEYAPYAEDSPTVGRLQRALQDDDIGTALEAIEDLLAFNYLDIDAHIAADFVYLQLEDHAQSGYHRAFAKGLIDAILATGNGRNFETAFIVLRIAEEYTILRVMGFAPAGQRLVQHEGHWFDVLSARHTKTEATVELCFNIDMPRGWQEAQLGG